MPKEGQYLTEAEFEKVAKLYMESSTFGDEQQTKEAIEKMRPILMGHQSQIVKRYDNAFEPTEEDEEDEEDEDE